MKVTIRHNQEVVTIEGSLSEEDLLKKSKEYLENYYKKEFNQVEINGEKYKCEIKIVIPPKK